MSCLLLHGKIEPRQRKTRLNSGAEVNRGPCFDDSSHEMVLRGLNRAAAGQAEHLVLDVYLDFWLAIICRN